MPIPQTPTKAAPRAPSDTPIRRDGRAQGTNNRASIEHKISQAVVRSENMGYYIELACSCLDRPSWNVIANDTDIQNALQAVLDVAEQDSSTKPGVLEEAYYGPTVRLCNLVSLAVFKVFGLSASADAACIFASNPDTAPPGDFLDLRYRPDYHSFVGRHDELVLASQQERYDRPMCWAEMGLVGEQKRRSETDEGQLKSYITTAKRYRPDLPTVHGFLVHRGHIQLSQLNASGMWSSEVTDIGDLKAWVALVILVYQSYQQSDLKLSYNAQQPDFPRWDFSDAAASIPSEAGARPLVLAPFYVASAPGRVTWASYEVASASLSTDDATTAFNESEVQGFWKTSWQQEGRSQERELLDRLHTNGWLPGLVRPYPGRPADRLQVPTPDDIIHRAYAQAVRRSSVDSVVEPIIAGRESDASSEYDSSCTFCENDQGNEDGDEDAGDAGKPAFFPSLPDKPPKFVTRVQEIVHLASIGEPLSQCASPRELLEIAYDLLQVHIHMWDEGVLHRDISWFNVLRKPKHYIGGEEKPQPCIKKILYRLAPEDALSETGSEDDLSPTVLLTDLDHAIDKNVLGLQKGDDRERTGTAMFISFELSDDKAQYPHLGPPAWANLLDALTFVDHNTLGAAAFSRAFPNGDGGLVEQLKTIRELELNRHHYGKLSGRPTHNPRHDAESIYWLLLYAFARARPRGAPQETDEARLNQLAAFCNTMLTHKVGDETARRQYLSPDGLLLQGLFHPSLSAFEDLLRAMGSYLSIPWHCYPTTVSPDHVHIAFRRMLLGYLLRLDAAPLDQALDTERPRRLEKGREGERGHSAWSTSIPSVGGSGRESFQDAMPAPPPPKPPRVAKHAPVPAPTVPSSAASGASMESSTASKKRKAAGERPGSALSTKRLKKSRLTGDLSPEELALRAREANKYVHNLHFNQRCAHALRLKAWKDRRFWFSKGE
ncbi:hypothetical protein AURDEDRAFT_167805 [Auricularia subglabra TFB-10046 SS5]|nr:hypothetical protein AURDEDRAFT_167805 [Auricularia subglabra TFB-10046 SS5]